MLGFPYGGGRPAVIWFLLPKPPSEPGKYTPEQRKAFDARLAESEAELRQGRGFAPFSTPEEMIASRKTELKKRALLMRDS